jgi:BMFP domain-containing protein YqiC
MSDSVLGQLRARGEQLFGRVSAELMANPNFMRALEAAWKGKAKLDEAVALALKRMNIPTRTEFKKALKRIDELESRLAGLESKPAKPARAKRNKA